MEIVTDRKTLVAALRRHGVDWLAPSDAENGESIEPTSLLGSLALHEDPRLRSALTGLFLLQPDLAEVVPDALAGITEAHWESGVVELLARYMAAVYLQRMWRTRLQLYLGEVADLPDKYSMMMDLPSANVDFGKPGLHALADWHQRETGEVYNRLAEYNRELEFVIASLKLRRGAREPASAG
jgi:hypothetical protein